MFVVFAIDGKKIDMMMPIAKKKTYTTPPPTGLFGTTSTFHLSYLVKKERTMRVVDGAEEV